MNDRNGRPNRLVREKSPYLLQHAYHPVDWFPWGADAFEKAEREDKPVFLSIGYSTCHWCHVMARESFEDEEVAAVLNRNFVAVKVDREERPDVDAVYMTACQAMTGSGGWPLTILMTPGQKPFYAGTYLPKHSRYSMPGLLDLLGFMAELWRNDRGRLLDSGEKIAEAVRSLTREAPAGDGKTAGKSVESAWSRFLQSFDEKNGGFGPAPKFPMPHNLMFLLRYDYFRKEARARFMAETTLRHMYRGGIFDQIGFGVSRYSTDAQWLVPHFEKMSCDNALLAEAFLEAYRVTRKPLYRTATLRIFEYVRREMTDEAGGFYCAQDADSDGEEGKYYVFTPEEIVRLLGPEDGADFNAYFQITASGNFEGKSIPNRIGAPEEEPPDARMERLISKVYEYRRKRTSLHKDDKILTSWNALMIAAYAKAYGVLGEERCLAAAEKADAFLKAELTDGSGRLRVLWRSGESAGRGTLDDYAFAVRALLELYEASFRAEYLSRAVSLCRILCADFRDETNGGFYLTANGAEPLIARPKETYDGALPSGNSVAAFCLSRIARLTGEAEWEEAAARQFRFLAGAASSYPAGHGFALLALMDSLFPQKDLVAVIEREDDLQKFRALLRKRFLPDTAVLVLTPENREELRRIAPFTRDFRMARGQSTFYLCTGRTCSAPITDWEELEKRL